MTASDEHEMLADELVEITRVWMSALPESVLRYLRQDEVEVLRILFRKTLAKEPIAVDELNLPKSMRRHPFADIG